jgi:molybdenum cofactor biosynthesis enzyme MoaA
MKKAVTFTINVGTSACPNRCKICISELTGKKDFDGKEVDWKAFKHCIDVAINYRCENVLLTGKGEPLLFPDLISKYLNTLNQYHDRFTRFELQTSGDGDLGHLGAWKEFGLDLVALSAYHYDDEVNDEMFCNITGARSRLADKVQAIKAAGLRVRLCFVMMRGCIDNTFKVERALDVAANLGVFQTTFRSVGMPGNPKDPVVEEFIEEHRLDESQEGAIKQFFDTICNPCDTLPFGGTVYEIFGQNACLTTCLDQCASRDELRNLIYFPPGTLATSWEYPKGTAIL